jgi:ABC-2 type transport system permease protein
MNSLNAALTVFRRELAAYFNAAIAYIFIIVFVLLSGGLYMTQFFLIGFADMRPFFTIMPFILAIFMPAVTMRLWAEEKRGNTLELLLTFPMATHEIVLYFISRHYQARSPFPLC